MKNAPLNDIWSTCKKLRKCYFTVALITLFVATICGTILVSIYPHIGIIPTDPQSGFYHAFINGDAAGLACAITVTVIGSIIELGCRIIAAIKYHGADAFRSEEEILTRYYDARRRAIYGADGTYWSDDTWGY